ncbi:uncharacterized protein K02A2.6-like isoform X3 [Daphnia magna]|uniref:uncharacterized protein K02A2.6-like isoform X3 n=2 Tax=Daphnia magna TaxID=35525 RepID=UPI001E1BC2B8|nr:uncharacterized protein K02A2.6-like isoform X3 [Daphnia magna]
MAQGLKFPDSFAYTAPNLALEWAQWRRQFEWYIKATRKDETDEEILVGVLLSLLGREGVKIYETLPLTAANAKKIAEVLTAFTTYFEPLKSEVFDRFLFHRRIQQPGESFDTWLLELRSMVSSCNFGTPAVIDSVLRDQIVFGVASEHVREKLLFETDLKLAGACNIVRACESASSKLTQMAPRGESTVHRLHDNQPKGKQGMSSYNKSSQPGGNMQQYVNCQGCGRRHRKDQCSAAKVVCFSCQQVGHYANRCPNGGSQQGTSHPRKMAPPPAPPTGTRQPTMRPAQRGTFMQQQLHAVEQEGFDGQLTGANGFLGEDYVTHQLTCTEEKVDEWYEDMAVDGNATIRFKLDSGATCNVLPYELYASVCPNGAPLEPGPRVRNYSANGGYLNVLGVYKGQVVRRGIAYVLRFVVVNEPGQPAILGLPACKLMKLIKRVHSITVSPPQLQPPIVKEFADVFNGIGKLPIEHEIRLATGPNHVDPVVSAAGRVPFSLEKKVFDKLDQMVADNIIAPVVEPTEWVSRMLVVGKPDGDVRICLDPSDLNKAIQRQHFMVPTVEQLFGKIGKARYFCSLDAASGFYQIPLSDRSSYLCTMATPKGRYRFLRLPFGLVSAPEVYLQAMSELFGDLHGVLIYFDDFLVMGETMEELECNLRRVLVRCREKNLKLQLKKCQFFVQNLPWLGHVIGNGSLKLDPEKVEAIVKMPAPTDKNGLIRLLGMDAAWVWDAQQEQALNALKSAISSLPVLRLFDVSKPLVVSVDASPIEKELLAVQFGLLRFRQYVYGQKVTVETDHKPLVGLLEKPIATCSPRIQRMRLQLQRFDFRLVYKPGKELFIADTLSRAPSPRLFTDDVTQDSEDQVHHVLHSLVTSVSTRKRYAEVTALDPTLQLLKTVIQKGWPEKRAQCPAAVKPYWSVRSELSMVEGILLCGSRLVVPMSLRRETMEGIHDGHFGETKSVLRAKSAVYWPGWEDQVKNMVASCSVCQENRGRNPKLPLHPVRLPDYAFQLVSADLFEFERVNYILLVDAYSKWPCVVPLKSTTSSAIIEEMSRFFCDFGRPEELESDNGTQFSSAEFREYCASLNIKQVTSSPEFAQSNGLVERHIQTVKRTLLKMFAEGKSLWEALAAIRSTPVSGSLPAPSVLLQGRNLRGVLPFLDASLSPKLVPASFVRQELSRRQQTAAFVQPRPVSVRSSVLTVGQRVRALIKGTWQLGVVNVVCPEPHSYIVRLSDGRMFRRTRWAINVDNANRPTAVQRTMQPSRPEFSRGPVVVPPTQPPALVQQSGSSAVAVQSPPVTARPVAGVNTPSGQSSVFQSSAQQESTPGRSVEAPSRPVREIPASPARLVVSRIPVRDRVVWLPPSASSGQHAPVAALGVTRSGRRYIKPLPPSQ